MAQWRRQEGQSSCGIASVAHACRAFGRTAVDEAAVLAALGTGAPGPEGLTLGQLEAVAAAAPGGPLRATRLHAGGEGLENATALGRVLAAKGPGVVVANYSMRELGQPTSCGGHHSLVGALSNDGVSALIMDVWRDTEPVWAEVGALFAAMRSCDAASGRSRGVLVVAPAYI